MITFVGSKKNGFFIEEYYKEANENMKIEYLGYVQDLELVFREITSKASSIIVIDITELIIMPDKTCEVIEQIRLSLNSKIIIYARGFNHNSNMILELKDMDIVDFIFSKRLSEQKQEFKRSLYNENVKDVKVNNKILDKVKIEKPIDDTKITRGNINYKTIAVTGCMRRIGTTTQALQIAKFLNLGGFKACYIELNRGNYIKKITEYYSGVTVNHELGKVEYKGIDLFYKRDKISEILNLGYDYYVYDFGSFERQNIVSYLEKDIKILVSGSKVDELKSMSYCLKSLHDKDTNYLFSFVSEQEQKDVLDIMEEQAVNTHFANYSPDPFALLSFSIGLYDGLLRLRSKKERAIKKKNLLNKICGRS